MTKKFRNYLTGLMAVTFLVSSALLAVQMMDSRQAQQAAQAAQDLAVPSVQESEPLPPVEVELPEPGVPLAAEPAEEVILPAPLSEDSVHLLDLDLDALRQVSSDVLGWISIPGTEVDYPLLALNNNRDGLTRTWDGKKSSAGSIFLECKNQRDFSDFNTLIYGHYMKNGTMFGSLKHYAQPDYLAEHPFIYIVTEDSVRRYEVFSAYEASVVSDTYRLYFEDDARRQSSLDHYVNSAAVDTGIIPEVDDNILTLSTCMGNGTYDTRWVVQAVLEAQFPRT